MQDLSALQSGQLTVGVVANNEAKRRRMIDAVNLRQVHDVKGFKTFAELLVAIEKEEVQWVLCTGKDEESVSLGTCLQKFLTVPANRNRACFSAILRMEEQPTIPGLFDKGLMSWHDNIEQPDEIAQLILNLQKQIESLKRPPLVSFNYLLSYLKSVSAWSQIIEFAERVRSEFPQEQSLRIHQIEGYQKMGNLDRARKMLDEIDFYDPDSVARISQLRVQLLDEKEDQHKLLAFQYQMRSAMIVDPNPESSSQLQAMLREFGFKQVQTFTNGEQAAAYAKNQHIDLAIIEWQCPGISGPFLIQRIRGEGMVELPVIVMTAVLDRADTQLVKDMGVVQVLKRPLKLQQLKMAVAWTITQTRNPTEATSYERRVQECLLKGDLEKAKQYFETFLTFDTRDPNKEKYLRAFILYKEKNYLEAKALLIDAAHGSGGDNVHVAALLSRCLIQLGDNAAALAVLKRVTTLSPLNVERLCNLSELALQMKDTKVAEQSLAHVQTLDPNAPRVQEAQAKLATATGQTERAMEIMKTLPNIENVIVYMNNLAVTSVKSGEFQEGVKVYMNCLKVIPAERPEFQAVVAYNLGLALLRHGDNEGGAVFVKQAADLGPSTVLDRAVSLHKRILEARRQGMKLQLKSKEPTPSSAGGSKPAEEPAEQTLAPPGKYFLLGLITDHDEKLTQVAI